MELCAVVFWRLVNLLKQQVRIPNRLAQIVRLDGALLASGWLLNRLNARNVIGVALKVTFIEAQRLFYLLVHMVEIDPSAFVYVGHQITQNHLQCLHLWSKIKPVFN